MGSILVCVGQVYSLSPILGHHPFFFQTYSPYLLNVRITILDHQLKYVRQKFLVNYLGL